MGDGISTPAVLFILFILGVFVTILIISARKKNKLAKLIEANIASLPHAARELYDSCRNRDELWIETYGTTLDAIELTDPMEIAVDAGWRSMDLAAELLTDPAFAAQIDLKIKFADKLMEEFAKEVEG